MNIKCPNCKNFKTKKNRSILFYLLFTFFVVDIISFIFIPLPTLSNKDVLINTVVCFVLFLLPMIIYDILKIKYICKSCGFKFTNKKEIDVVKVDFSKDELTEQLKTTFTNIIKTTGQRVRSADEWSLEEELREFISMEFDPELSQNILDFIFMRWGGWIFQEKNPLPPKENMSNLENFWYRDLALFKSYDYLDEKYIKAYLLENEVTNEQIDKFLAAFETSCKKLTRIRKEISKVKEKWDEEEKKYKSSINNDNKT